MKKANLIALAILMFSTMANSQSASDCRFLLTDGIRNYIKTKSYEKDYELVRSEVCKAYNSYKMDNSVGKASAKYKAIFKGKASYSRTEIEAIGEASCNRSLDVSEYISNQSEYSEIIDPNWAKVVSQCINSNANGVRYKIQQSEDGYLGDLSITVVYRGTSADDAPTITSIDADNTFFEISGDLKNAIGKRLTRAYTLKIKRKNMDRKDPITFAGKKVLLPSGVLTIGVSSGENLNLVYPEMPYEEPVVVSYGVGEVVSSLLDVNTFLNTHNKNGQQWMLAEDKEVPLGTAYRKYLDNNFPQLNGMCPDLRGVFLRGKNHGREDGTGNPDPKELGMHQMDAYAEHSHSYVKYHERGNGSKISITNNPGHSSWPYAGGATKDTGESGNGEETRPRNVTVNYFIRIN